ncbi:uncharacterized protein YciI [Paraburkholderia sp. BL23I1N1]|uniref:YciI family protein n=1 Tax=Paraburkholderia sp. BL23I1N1 TaxID=1938802 RepID=UPI000E73E416|nr:YciI family protein [Paraburkholderia sp. BL23I1N1]RKE38577.1 uncharacterized protein YciI [Paraburkholderia sp. BL23I1N1]
MTHSATPYSAEDDALETLKKSFNRMTMYVVTLDTSALDPDPVRLFSHLTWLKEQEAGGVIAFTGLRFDGGNRPVDGMTVLRAGSFQEAERIVASDPFVAAGATATIHRWDVAAGAMSFSVRLSDRSVGVI